MGANSKKREMRRYELKKHLIWVNSTSYKELKEKFDVCDKVNTYENYTNLINPSDDSNRALSCKADVMDEMENIRVYIKSNIDYDELVERHRTSKASIDEIVELVVETIAMKTETIRIKGLDMPYEVVKSRFEKLDSVIIEYVLESVGNNTTKVRNIKNYLLTVLFNAPTTCNNYYVTEVNHDLYGKS